MERLTRWVLGHRLLVCLAWLAVAVTGGVLAPTTVDRLSYAFDLPGQPAYETNTFIEDEFGGGGLNDPVLLVARGEDAARVAAAAGRAAAGLDDQTRVVTAETPGAGRLTSSDGELSVVVVYPVVTPGPEPYAAAAPALDGVAEQVTREAGGGTEVQVTSFLELQEGVGSDRGVLAEVLVGGLGALVVLLLVFGSLLAGVPLLVAAVSILGTFLALLGLTHVTDVSFVVQYLVALIGLGVAIDYSLLVVTRWREERGAGLPGDEAVVRAMTTAGRAVLFSGITVAVSLAALVLVPLPFLRSIGLGGLLIPTLSVATSLTLVPAVLSLAGGRLLWPRRQAAVSTRSRLWTRVARGVLGRRWLTIAGASVVLLALAAPVVTLTLGTPQLSGLSSSAPASRTATAVVEADVPAGVLRPIEVVAPDDVADSLGRNLRGLPGVGGVAEPGDQRWRDGDQRLLQVWLSEDPASAGGRAALDAVRGVAGDVDARVGGTPAEDADFVSAVYGDVVWVVLAVVVVTFLLLARALRSLWLPVKALLLNVVSIAAAYGATVLIWQEGYGSDLLFGQDASGVITTWVPIAAFAFLFGLSMDYEVFILSRMREAYDEHGDTDRAVVDGIGFTGRLVTSAALILVLAFVALSTVPAVEVKILATALALGIAIDALVVRALLAPALVAVLGRLNWTMPRWLGVLTRTADAGPRHRAG